MKRCGRPGRAARPAAVLALLAPVLLATAGCGFKPLYGGTGPGSVAAKLEQVEITTIPDRHGQQLRNLLIDRFYEIGRPGNPRYRLDATLIAAEQPLALQKDSTAVRAQLLVNAPYRLVETATGKVVFQANSRSYISYSVLEQQYAGLVTVDAAYDRALVEISNDITTRVAMFLGRGT